MSEDDIIINYDVVLATPEPTPLIIVSESENEQYYLQTCEKVNNFIDFVIPAVNIATGFIQFLMVLVGVVAFYKLLRIFF
jgi:hypothetical protein